MRTSLIVLAIFATGASLVASADSIRIGDKVYENVYVSEGANIYYVSVPSDGSVLNVAKSDVDAKSIAISEDREARKALYNAWIEKRKELRGEAASTPADSEFANNVEPPKAEVEGEREPRVKTISGTGQSTVSSYDPQSFGYAAAQQYNDVARFQREAQLDARRHRRESEKIRTLTQRRVITSEDARGSSVTWGGAGLGGSGQSGFGGNGGYGGSLGSMGRR